MELASVVVVLGPWSWCEPKIRHDVGGRPESAPGVKRRVVRSGRGTVARSRGRARRDLQVIGAWRAGDRGRRGGEGGAGSGGATNGRVEQEQGLAGSGGTRGSGAGDDVQKDGEVRRRRTGSRWHGEALDLGSGGREEEAQEVEAMATRRRRCSFEASELPVRANRGRKM